MRGAIRRGEVRRLRKGWLCVPDAPASLVTAVRIGGRLACLSAAEHHGLWVPPHAGVHVALSRHAGYVRPQDGAVLHWQTGTWMSEPSPIENLGNTIRQIVRCCPSDFAIAVLDSALHTRKLSTKQLAEVLAPLPSRFRALAQRVDAASASGLESLCRLNLVQQGATVRSQVDISGVGRVDFVVGDRLIIEVDGYAWHKGEERYHDDRSRLLAAAQRGYETLRPTAQHILFEAGWFESTVRAKVRRGEHLWSHAHRTDPACDGYRG